jgi:cardiolipin synthase
MTPVAILTEEDYFADIIPAIRRLGAGSRVCLTTMDFHPRETIIAALVEALVNAAKRGAIVYFMVDAHTFMYDYDERATGPLLRTGGIEHTTSLEFLDKYASLQTLAAAGGYFSIVNKPATRMTVPIAGRSHIKTCVINDTVYIGGVNLGKAWQIDFMTRFADREIADWIFGFVANAVTAGSVRKALRDTDRELRLDTNSTILVDAGKRNQSAILAAALRVIDEAREHIFITCQFFPNSITAAHLARAHRRGVKVEVFYNHPGKQTRTLGVVQKAILLHEKMRLPAQLFLKQLPATHRRIHAKVLATDKAAIIGSHNYVNAGVRLGTAEIALLRHDPAFAREVIQKVRPYLEN